MITTPFIANVIITPFYNSSGNHTQWTLTPAVGYVLHDKVLDHFEEYDDEGNPIGEPVELGYSRVDCSCRYDYDFTANPREFYAVLETEVPENGVIFNVGNDHVVA